MQLQLWLDNPKIQLTIDTALQQLEAPYNSKIFNYFSFYRSRKQSLRDVTYNIVSASFQVILCWSTGYIATWNDTV